MRILILKPSSLGDVVQAIPVLRLLKKHFPQGEIFWWIDDNLAPILENDPDLNGLILFHRKRWQNPLYWYELVQSVVSTRNLKFDIVIDLQGLARSGFFGWYVNADLYIGVDEPREGARGFYDIIVQRPTFYTHAVDWYLETLKYINVPVHFNFDWLPERPHIKKAVEQKLNFSDGKLIVICPETRWASKNWLLENFAGLVKILSNNLLDFRFAILASAKYFDKCEQIRNSAPERCLNLAGKTTIQEMIEIIRMGAITVSNDSAPMHISAALKKPVVAIFGPTEPRRTGPYGFPEGVIKSQLDCSPCFKRRCRVYDAPICMSEITVDVVAQKVISLLFRNESVNKSLNKS